MNSDNPGLQGVRVLVGVSGSIAAYKAAEWVRALVKEEALVTVMMTSFARQFVSSLTFSALSGNRVYYDMFEDDAEGVMAHINLTRENDVVLIAPATAQTIARLRHGMADDLISTACLASNKPVVVCPAMNTNMYVHQATQSNLAELKRYGYYVVDPDSGELACGEVGDGRLPDWEIAREALLGVLSPKDLQGQNILITAGPTREALDPVRYLTNRSSGKMGYALARAAQRRGARVTLVSGPVTLPAPPGVHRIQVQSALEMEQEVMTHLPEVSVVIKSAAVADYRPKEAKAHKIKKNEGGLALEFTENNDILAHVGRKRVPGQVIVGFAAESKNHIQEGQRKLRQKNADLIVVNDILGAKTGFDVDTNQVTLVDAKDAVELPLLSKEGTANRILDRVVQLLNPK